MRGPGRLGLVIGIVLGAGAALAGGCGGKKQAPTGLKSPPPPDGPDRQKNLDEDMDGGPGGGGASPANSSDPCEGGETRSDPCEGGEHH